jgi:hypothetical protein
MLDIVMFVIFTVSFMFLLTNFIYNQIHKKKSK